MYFELRIPECSRCFGGYTVCGYCHQGNLLTDRLSCGHRAVSSDDGKRYLVKRSLFKGCNFRWSWKNLSNGKKEFENWRHTFISGNCATSNEVWAIRNTQWGVVSKSDVRSEEHTSELQSRETISYAVFCLKKKKKKKTKHN